MKIAVMGAGAVGCYYGAMLARAGHDITLVARPRHVLAVQRDGLLLETATGRDYVRVAASSDVSSLVDAELVLVCVKSADTETAGREMAGVLRPDAVLLSLQNGVDNAARLQACVTNLVIPTVVYVATEMAGPGHVRHHGRGELVIGDSPASAKIAATFTQSLVRTDVAENVIGALWAKLILNCAYNAMSALGPMAYGELVQHPGAREVIDDVVHECLQVAQADGVSVVGDVQHAVAQIALTMPGQLSSTAQDLARGKPTEIDFLNGYVVRRGEALGVPVPVNRVLWTLVKLVERRSP